MIGETEHRGSGWYQAPHEPEGVERYWTGTRWADIYRGKTTGNKIALWSCPASMDSTGYVAIQVSDPIRHPRVVGVKQLVRSS
jgi:hypothetical protein